MPALTAKSIADQLSDYIQPGRRIQPILNLVMPRLYAMGYWRDLCYELNIETGSGYVALPSEAESVMAAMIDESPRSLWSQWHDYRIGGMPAGNKQAYPIFGLVDDGYWPCKEVLDDTKNHTVTIFPVSPETNLPTGGWVSLTAELANGSTSVEEIELSGGASVSFAATTVRRIVEIRFDGVAKPVRVSATNDAGVTYYVLAEERGNTVARYRRFRCQEPNTGETQNVRLLLKRAFLPILDENDVIHLGNLNAIKHALLANTAEDNADIERANYHWGVCRQILEDEKDAMRGGARQSISIDPYSGNGGLYNMY